MNRRKLQALFNYARKQAAADSSNSDNDDSDDIPQIVRDITKEFEIDYTPADNAPELITLTPLNDDNVSLVIQGNQIEVYCNGTRIDVVTSWADDFDSYQAAVTSYNHLEKVLAGRDYDRLPQITITRN
jgi:hypothetical protein